MAETRQADMLNQTPELWAGELFAQAEHQTFFGAYEGGEGSGAPIIRKDDLTKEVGDRINFDMVLALVGAGISGEAQSLEGNEEALKFRDNSLVVDEVAHAVKATERSQTLSLYDKQVVGKRQLAKWIAGRADNDMFAELSGNGDTTMPTKNKWAAGTATSRATVADTNAGGRLTLDSLTEAKAYAQEELKIEPIRLEDGEEVFLLVAHGYAVMELKRDDTKWAQAQREAQTRGANNPLFTGAAGMWDGVIIRTSNRVPDSSNGAVNVADNIFMGAQAAMRGWAKYPSWREEMFDYGRRFGVATVFYKGEKLNVFDLTPAGGAADADKTAVGSMVLYSAAVAPGQP